MSRWYPVLGGWSCNLSQYAIPIFGSARVSNAVWLPAFSTGGTRARYGTIGTRDRYGTIAFHGPCTPSAPRPLWPLRSRVPGANRKSGQGAEPQPDQHDENTFVIHTEAGGATEACNQFGLPNGCKLGGLGPYRPGKSITFVTLVPDTRGGGCNLSQCAIPISLKHVPNSVIRSYRMLRQVWGAIPT